MCTTLKGKEERERVCVFGGEREQKEKEETSVHEIYGCVEQEIYHCPQGWGSP